MRRHIAGSALLLALGAASCGPQTLAPAPDGGTPVLFRILAEGQSATYCVDGPSFALAETAEEWSDIAARHGACQPDGAVLAPVRWGAEVGLAAWWKTEGCLGYSVSTDSVRRSGDVVTVSATTTSPAGDACATALGGLESFYALDAAAVGAATSLVFVLDGREVGSIAL